MEAFEWKKLLYSDLVAEAAVRGWKAEEWPVDVGCRGFVTSSTSRLLKDLGISAQALRKAIKELANMAEISSH